MLSNGHFKYLEEITSALRSRSQKFNKASYEKLGSKYHLSLSEIKELTELAVVNLCREIIAQSNGFENTFKSIVEFYQYQPNISLRTTNSILFQQYSTASPISYVASYFCAQNFTSASLAFEPSAGNGLLTIALPKKQVVVNELDKLRNNILQTQGFHTVTNLDGSLDFRNNKPYGGITFDAILTNPPFGGIEPVTFGKYTFKVLDHVMVIRALNMMKQSGKAAIIIGGHTAWDSEGRIQAGKNRIFLSYLHENYNVLDCINIDGSLYSRQGTSFNVRMILIDGRKDKPSGYAPLYNANNDYTVNSFENLYNRVANYMQSSSSSIINEAELLAIELELMNL